MNHRDRQRAPDETGQVVVLFAICLVVLLGFAALVLDVGFAYYADRSLQASADAAALAGAQELPDAATATTLAREYSGSAGAKNVRGNVPGVSTTVATKCLDGGTPCDPVNAVEVTQTAAVPVAGTVIPPGATVRRRSSP